MVTKLKQGTGQRYVPTAKEKWAVFSLLREHIQTIEGSEKIKYAEGWTDAKVAETVGGAIRSTHVARYRREAIGDLYFKPVGQANSNSNKRRLDDIETSLNANKRRLDDIETSLNALCDSLGVPQFRV